MKERGCMIGDKRGYGVRQTKRVCRVQITRDRQSLGATYTLFIYTYAHTNAQTCTHKRTHIYTHRHTRKHTNSRSVKQTDRKTHGHSKLVGTLSPVHHRGFYQSEKSVSQYSAHKSSDHNFSKIYKVCPDTNLQNTKQYIQKHNTQNYLRISPFSIAPVQKAHKARMCCYRGFFGQ